MVSRTPDTDLQLLTRYLRSGDQDAFAVLLKRHWELVMKICRRVLDTDSEAEDVAQTVFIKLMLKSFRVHDREASLAGWLRHVAVCEARNLRTRQRARAIREQYVSEGRALSAPEDTGASEERERILRVLDEELEALPPRYRDALYSFYMDNWSLKQIAQATGKDLKCIKNRLQNGRKKLSERMKKRLGVTPAAVVGVLENLPEAPPIPEGFIAQTARTAMQIRQGLAPTGLSLNAAEMMALSAKGSWSAAKILAGVFALLTCVGVVLLVRSVFLSPGKTSAEVHSGQAADAAGLKKLSPLDAWIRELLVRAENGAWDAVDFGNGAFVEGPWRLVSPCLVFRPGC